MALNARHELRIRLGLGLSHSEAKTIFDRIDREATVVTAVVTASTALLKSRVNSILTKLKAANLMAS